VRFLAILLAVPALAACGGHKGASPEAVARAWSAALDRSDNEAAAALFAKGAQVIQSDEITLDTHDDALAWNRALPCGGRIKKVIRRAPDEVLVVFLLDERPRHTCDAPGADAAAIFRVEHGKIVLWHQTVPPDEEPPPDGAV
jgi:xanthine/CO dehydrogenase XdhC/CoxF family maturation factor